MKKKTINLFLVLALLLVLVPTIFLPQVFADNPDSEHYRVRTVTLADGTSIDEVVINGPPTPPLGYERATAELPEPNPEAGLNVLSDVPAFDWSFGCSATSAAMIAGYYDRTGYANMYAGPTNGGVMPMDNSAWPDWVDSHGDTRHQCPLSATHNDLDGRTTRGHVDDYWIYNGQPGPDPWVGNPPEHPYDDCTGDFMKTNQWFASQGFNTDGSTVFYNYESGAPLSWSAMEGYGIHIYDGGYGVKLFYESRGYTVTDMYNQYIKGQGNNLALGFTYAQYKAEIDAGRPVMIHLYTYPYGHTMVGLGYDDSSNLTYIHDTWDYNTSTMPWGGNYGGMQHRGVTIVQLQSLPEITSCDAAGNEKNQFATNQSVYVKGSGLETNTDYNIWIQNDSVDEGKTLVPGEDPSGAQETVTTGPSKGNPPGGFPATEIWPIPQNEPVTHHPYDIIVDKQSDGGNTGKYNAASDGIDSASAVGITAPVPELPTIILFSIGLLVFAGYIQLRRKNREVS